MNGHQATGQHAQQGQQPPPPARSQGTFPCPECASVLPAGTTPCPSCGIRLSGPVAAQLWRVNNQIAGLTAESRRLRGLLMQPPSEAELAEEARVRAEAARGAAYAAGTSLPPLVPGMGSPEPARGSSASSSHAASSPSGQQVLLGIGALLLLSGVAFFLVVVWTLIGLVGQAVVMVVLTALAAGGAALATRRRLPATAETAGVIATGLLLLDLWAAHGLGLAGLDRFDADVYWTFAAVLGAALLLGFDALVPRRDATGELRRVVVYRPAAVLLLTVALWTGLSAVEPRDLGVSLGALVVAVLSLGLALVVRRWQRGEVEGTLGLVVPGLSAALAVVVHLAVAVGIGYDDRPLGERMLAMVLLLVVPGIALAAQWHPALRGSTSLRVGLRVLAVAGFVVALGIGVFGAPRGVVVTVAVVVGLLLTALALTDSDGRPGRDWEATTWGDVATWSGRLVLPLIFWLVLLLSEQGMSSGVDMRSWTTDAGPASWWLPVLPALAFVVPTAITAVRRDSVLLAVLAHVGAVAAVVVALDDSESIVRAVVCLVAAVVAVALAAVARWAALEGRNASMESIALVAAAVYATASLGAAIDVSAFTSATVLIALGALLLAYASLPGRLGVAYVAAGVLTAGIAVLLADAGVDTVELYTAPAVLLLAGIGAVQWSQDRAAPTVLTMGPALVVALVPSLLVALFSDSGIRLFAVTVAALVVLLVGMAQRWQAPVVVAGVVLGVLAVTQGGPLVAYVDGWVTLVLSGLLLLLVGVLWERAINLGRRTSAWLNAMQ